MENKYKLIACDMDGTFLNSDSYIPDAHVRVVDECEKRGIAFAICSGRTLPALRTMRERLSYRGYVIGANGGHIVTGDRSKTIYHRTLSVADAKKMLEVSKELDAHLMVWHGDTLYVDRDDEISDFYERLSFHPKNLYDHENPEFLRDCVGAERSNIEKMFWCDSPERITELIEKAKQLVPETVGFYRSGGKFVEIIDKEVNKGNAILKLCEYLGITPDEVVCFGDAENDLAMLKLVGLPVAMGNAVDSVKNACKMVTDTNDNDGVWKAFCKIFG